MSASSKIAREYARHYQSGRQLTKTSIARDLIVNKQSNDFIRAVIMTVFGEYWENRSINRVRKNIAKN